MKLKQIFLTAFSAVILFTGSGVVAQNKAGLSLIPKPVEMKVSEGYFLLSSGTKLYFPAEVFNISKYLKDIIFTETGIPVNKETALKNTKNSNGIYLTIVKDMGEEAYKLTVTKSQVLISASTEHGLFNGVQTLRQMYLKNLNSPKANTLKINCAEINDSPRFAWRGLNLDCCRHFMTKDFVKRYIDLLALHKMNILHWHLTDDQGWRIEIKKYPELTNIGAWRKDKDGNKYGGFYTQEDIKEVVAYAKSRFITVVPEIEMPGHAQASLASYPQHSCAGGPFEVGTQWGVMKDIYCAGNDNTFTFIEDVLKEVIELFPGQYIHIGGDEAPKDRWKECPKCQARIKTEGLKNEHELQSYFIKRIGKFLTANNKKFIGWDEILEGGLAPNATVQSWRGVDGAVAAAKSGHNAIVSPHEFTYFDLSLVETDLKKAYSFEPVPAGLTEAESKFIIGGEANMWTERAPQETIDSKLFPRILALAECVWSDKSIKNYDDFISRVQKYYSVLDKLNVTYGPESRPISIIPSFDREKNLIRVKLESGQKGTDVFYTLDGSMPSSKSLKYKKEFVLEKSKTVKAVSMKNNKAVGDVVSQKFIFHKATGKKISIKNSWTEKYSAGGVSAVIDGMRGTSAFNDGYWQGYEGKDFDGIIDLGKETDIKKISAGFLQNNGSWIFMPQSVSFSISNDGKDFTMLKDIPNDIPVKASEIIQKDFTVEMPVKTRYIKVEAKSIGMCPAGHPGEGGKAWLFTDEIIVE